MRLFDILKRGKKKFLILTVAVVTFVSFGFTDSYFEISKNIEIFTTLYRELNIYYVDETQPGDLMKTGIEAMLKSLDPYTVFYPESRIEDYRFMTTGQYGGIGALVQTIDGKITISEPYKGYSAQEAGLMAGDVITHVDGKSVDGKAQSEISEILKGQAGTEVELTVVRIDETQPIVVKLARQDVKIPDVPYSGMLDDETGYIILTGFTKTASIEVRKAYKELESKGMKRLVFDLRGNGGGLLREAVNIVNMFVPKGTEVVSTKGKLEEWNKTHVALNEPINKDIPLIIVVDGGSASASEIVSGTLQDLDRAVVIGEQTFGKGLVQQTKDLNYNTKLKLTVAKYYTPSGRCIQKLDYSHRGDDGEVLEVPDSLIKPFYTVQKRPVFDGRGITPDVKVDRENASNVLNSLITNHVIFDFATRYRADHDSINAPVVFNMNDEEYSSFVSFALNEDFEYETRTELMFERLKKIAAEEKYLKGAEEDFDELYAEIKPDKQKDLMKFRDEIEEVLENEIISRYYYQEGRILYSLDHDPVVEEALEVFSSTYDNILAPK